MVNSSNNFSNVKDYFQSILTSNSLSGKDRQTTIRTLECLINSGELKDGILTIYPSCIKERNVVSAIQCEILSRVLNPSMPIITVNRCTSFRDGSITIDVESCLAYDILAFYGVGYYLINIVSPSVFYPEYIDKNDIYSKVLSNTPFLDNRSIKVVKDYIDEFIIDYSIIKEVSDKGISLEEYEPYIDALNNITIEDLSLEKASLSNIKYICDRY